MPKIHLTAKIVENLRPDNSQKDYWERNLPKFGIRVSAHGRKTWNLLYRFEGRLYRYSLGTFPDLCLADAAQDRVENQAVIEFSNP